ncbi:MAG: AMP-binding protein [Alphaproteobacteria bacterium]|nr:AMP-binding protein [Alphaproteobacteria bacterium]
MIAAGFLELFLSRSRNTPEALFARFDGRPITFGTLAGMAEGCAIELRRQAVRRGDRVAVMMRNGPAVLPMIFGLARAGAVWVPINAQLRGPGLAYVLEHCEPALVIADAEVIPTIAQSGGRLGSAKLITGGDIESWFSETAEFDAPLPMPEDCLAIFYTSGTTGPPKGVMLSHAMLRFASEAVALVAAPSSGDVLLMWEPLYHIGGAQLLVLPLIRDVTLAMVDRFSARRFWQQAREYGASHIHYLGGILQLLLKQPASALDRAHGVRVAWGGGCPADIWRLFEERFQVEIREAYGMTEASSITTYNHHGVVGSVGRPVPWFEVSLRDPAGNSVAPGERGEIVVHTNHKEALFAGYFRDPDATARALRGGALWTGDLGRFNPDGDLIFLGRISDSVRCRGENVSAWEVERVVAAHPDVEDCAIIGVAADIGEQEIKLFVRPKEGAAIDPAELSRWLGERLAPYQNPRYVAVVESFERTPSQRIAKQTLQHGSEGCWDRLA